MVLQFTLYRESFLDDRTIGTLLLNGEFYGYTLEDTVRPIGKKIYGKTAIYDGHYSLSIKYSNKYKENRVFLNNVPLFSGVQIHGGNSPEDTEGCILAAKHLVNNGTQIQGSLKDDIIEKVSKSDHAFIEIINLNQL